MALGRTAAKQQSFCQDLQHRSPCCNHQLCNALLVCCLPHPARRRAFSAAQLVLQAAVGWRCAGDLPFCFLLQTMLFVAFNKVRLRVLHLWCQSVHVGGLAARLVTVSVMCCWCST